MTLQLNYESRFLNMKKFLITKLPLIISTLLFLIVSGFLRYNLYLSTQQLSKEFLSQNAREMYSIDTMRISSRLNSFSRSLNWVCIEAEVNKNQFFKMTRGSCTTSLFQQRIEIFLEEANNLKVAFTIKPPKELEILFFGFLILQIALVTSLVFATKLSEQDSRQRELKWLQLSRKMFHDIRSPLASLNSISSDLHWPSETEQSLFSHSITRINEIANSLLSDTQNSLIKLPEYSLLPPLLNELIKEKKLEFPQLQIESNSGLESSQVLIVPSEFKRIFSNLINNAIEASDTNPLIEIHITSKEDNLFLDIIDHGKGIPSQVLLKLGLEEITSKKSGNGIGFKDAKETLLEWGGNLEITKTDSSGTTIRLHLKAKSEPIAYYLIDDDSLVRLTWEAKAKKKDIKLNTFSTPNEFETALHLISKNSAIYIDSELGHTKGEVLAEKLLGLGFLNLHITSGHSPESFSHLTFIKSVISKAPPF